MPDTGSIVVGDLVLKALPELLCYKDFESFVKDIPNLFAIRVPSTITNVIVSNQQPTNSQTTSLWIRQSNSGSFMGIYVFAQGLWRQIAPIPNQIFWLYGDSNNPPAGFKTTDDASGIEISATLAVALKAQWVAGNLAGPPYEYFSCVFDSF